MISIRLPLALIIAFVLCVLGYFISASLQESSAFSIVTPVFVLITTFLFCLPTLLSNSSAKKATQGARKETRGSKAKSTHKPSKSVEGQSSLYVGNLPYKANETSVKELFETVGKVHSVRLMKDRKTGRRKGFGFVEVESSDSDKFIAALNDHEYLERTIKVRQAKERAE